MYIFPDDAFKMHPSFLKMAILSCVYKDRIRELQRQVNEVTPLADSLLQGHEREKPKQEFFYCRAFTPKAKKWLGPSPENRSLSQKLGLGNKIDILA